jgi:hypothetical protein
MAKLPKSNPLDADHRLAGHAFFVSAFRQGGIVRCYGGAESKSRA